MVSRSGGWGVGVGEWGAEVGIGECLKRGNHVLGYNSKWLRVVVLTELLKR